ncbi:MAG: beta-lactamase family protein [Acetobacter peroxydans]|nr:beta-lactamase family protein [Acetobacter peroxydans]
MPPAFPFATPHSRRTFIRNGLALGSLGTGARLLRSQAHAASPSDAFRPVAYLCQNAVEAGLVPGMVAAVGHQGQVVWRGVFGQSALLPAPAPMLWSTQFDMASLTKVLVTAPAVMQLQERGLVNLDTPAWRYLPGFEAQGKQAITLRLLLTHYSGLPPDLPLDTPWQGREQAIGLVMDTRPTTTPGERFVYSDINYIVLGLIVERLSGLPLSTYAKRHIFAPLGLRHTTFSPHPEAAPTIAPTQYDENGHMLQGVVHDQTARRMGGVAGHAGLFSCAQDMILYTQAMLDKRAGLQSFFPLQTRTLRLMSTPQQPPGKTDLRGLGWDIATHYSTPRGDYFPKTSFGHTGFTGTSLWAIPDTRSFVLILSNRVHPRGGQSIVALRHDIATAAALALRDTTVSSPPFLQNSHADLSQK